MDEEVGEGIALGGSGTRNEKLSMASEGRGGNGREKDGSGGSIASCSQGDRRHCRHEQKNQR